MCRRIDSLAWHSSPVVSSSAHDGSLSGPSKGKPPHCLIANSLRDHSFSPSQMETDVPSPLVCELFPQPKN